MHYLYKHLLFLSLICLVHFVNAMQPMDVDQKLTCTKLEGLRILSATDQSLWPTILPRDVRVEAGKFFTEQMDHDESITFVSQHRSKEPWITLFRAIERGHNSKMLQLVGSLYQCLADDQPYPIYDEKNSICKYLGEYYPITYACKKGEYYPITYACKKGNLQVVKILLSMGASLALCDRCNRYALGEAGKKGHSAIFEYVLPGIAAISKRAIYEDYSSVGFYAAIKKGHTQIVKLYLENGFDPSKDMAACSIATSVLSQAIEYPDITRLLLDHGVDPKKTNMMGVTAKRLAEIHGYLETVAVFQEYEHKENELAEKCSVK